MTKYENECVGCPTEMGCLGNWCPYINVERHYCDECGEGIDEWFDLYGEELCEYCYEKRVDEPC